MPIYHELYFDLFNAQADIIEEMERLAEKLRKAHQAAEKKLMEAEPTSLLLLKPQEDER